MSTNKNIEVGTKIVMNQDYRENGKTAKKGYKGKVIACISDQGVPALFCVKFQKKFRLEPMWIFNERFDVVPAKGPLVVKPIKEIPAKKAPVKKGIRIKVREVKRDVFEIVDFTALDWINLPPEYCDGFPSVGIQEDRLRVIKAKDQRDWFCRGNFLTGVQLCELVETFEKAGERLRRINTYPKKAFEVVI